MNRLDQMDSTFDSPSLFRFDSNTISICKPFALACLCVDRNSIGIRIEPRGLSSQGFSIVKLFVWMMSRK